MTERYLFADESGDFTFAKGPNISRYFIVCTVTMENCEAAHTLLGLRRCLLWEDAPVRAEFHASEDAQAIRDAVYAAIITHDFRVQATIMEKSKAQPQVRTSNARFYQYGWHYHFGHAIAKYATNDDKLLITTASVSTKKAQGAFTSAVNDVVQQHLPRDQWKTFFCPSACDPCLQLTDYCTWAIQRKWERNDTKSYDLIKDRISYEFDLWAHGRKHYY